MKIEEDLEDVKIYRVVRGKHSNGLQPKSEASNLLAMTSNLLASNLRAMASNVRGMASNLIARRTY